MDRIPMETIVNVVRVNTIRILASSLDIEKTGYPPKTITVHIASSATAKINALEYIFHAVKRSTTTNVGIVQASPVATS